MRKLIEAKEGVFRFKCECKKQLQTKYTTKVKCTGCLLIWNVEIYGQGQAIAKPIDRLKEYKLEPMPNAYSTGKKSNKHYKTAYEPVSCPVHGVKIY